MDGQTKKGKKEKQKRRAEIKTGRGRKRKNRLKDNNMKYIDRIYGEFEIREPVIIELINSPALQRLKGIDQIGYRPLWVKPEVEVKDYEQTRFAHSLGVYLLLREYGAPIEEQIAGLIHNVSHSAFSHCIDYVLDSGSEKEHNHQDNIFEDFVKGAGYEPESL